MEHEKKDQSPVEKPTTPAEKSTPKRKPQKGKVQVWLILVTIVLLFLAYLYIQQLFLDIEAEAIIYARMTEEALQSEESDEAEVEPKVVDVTATPTIMQASDTVSPNFWHTQTVSVQLTAISEFQETAGAE